MTSPPPVAANLESLALSRAKSEIRGRFERIGQDTKIARLFETGGLRLRFPRAKNFCEAVAVNTAGGIVGGDCLRLDFTAGPGAKTLITTQSAEKIYRSDGARASMDVSLRLEAGATLEWLPQETIFFDNANFSRRLEVDMAADACLVAAESVVFGRLAMGEICRRGFLQDRWRIRRDGRLIFAEDMRLSGDLAGALDRPAIGGGARAIGLFLLVAPEAEKLVEACRRALANQACETGMSAFERLCVIRLVSPSPEILRAAMLVLMSFATGRAAPRVWR